ncbi:Zn-ribbon domain-containing OB-fold protein [Paenibacillus thalictri]|uniref:Zn-ribbon domain-containing OB-fold protein n=1 Tax=Paenibacillus thalictri TaxID=2527873 RepID=A0A4Q9DV69_9BACL|nr:Zn-ribbon domain-containing OB-fold protein [Paenibacillus thalictri]TBL79850.1 Zn-ribbon domain-containing OB-fold protein [Paenibacillus thalictri]
MMESNKPIPIADGDSVAFWKGCNEGKLLIQHCQDCGSYIFYPRIVCPGCMSDHVEWIESKGKGKVYSYTVVRRSPLAFSDDVPYVVAMVELEEGVRMLSNIIHCSVDEVCCDMPVEVVFEKRGETALPMFQLAATLPTE